MGIYNVTMDYEVEIDARQCARTHLNRVGIEMRAMEGIEKVNQFLELLSELWTLDPVELINTSAPYYVASQDAGNYLYGAFRDNQLIGVAMAFIGLRQNQFILHSHYVGVLQSMRRQGIGTAIKLHQRAWALERNIEAITWTFDPLSIANARFNLKEDWS